MVSPELRGITRNYAELPELRGITESYGSRGALFGKLLTVSVPGSQHAGGGHWTEDDADYKAIRQWIAEGGRNN